MCHSEFPPVLVQDPLPPIFTLSYILCTGVVAVTVEVVVIVAGVVEVVAVAL